MANKAEVARVLMDLHAARDRELKNPESTLAAWVRTLRNTDAALFPAAFDLAAQKSPRWMPTAGEFLGYCREVVERGGKSPLDNEPTVHESYWNSMAFLGKALREGVPQAHSDRRIAGFMKHAAECDRECCK